MNHGTTTAYTAHGCRCQPCTRANTLAKKRWRLRTNADGDVARMPIRVDILPVQAHVARLLDSGWTKAQLARELGRSQQALYNLLDRCRSRSGHKTIRRDIAAQILAIPPLPSQPSVDDVVVERLLAGTLHWRQATADERLAAARVALRRDGGHTFCAEVLGLRHDAIRRLRQEVAA